LVNPFAFLYGRPHSGCTDTRLNGRRNYFRIGAESSTPCPADFGVGPGVQRPERGESTRARSISCRLYRAQNAGLNMHSFYKVLGRAPSTRMFIPFPHNVLGRAPSTRMFIPFPHNVLGRAPSTRMFMPHNPSTHVDTAPAVHTCSHGERHRGPGRTLPRSHRRGRLAQAVHEVLRDAAHLVACQAAGPHDHLGNRKVRLLAADITSVDEQRHAASAARCGANVDSV
jgi:hypothetical protein